MHMCLVAIENQMSMSDPMELELQGAPDMGAG